MADRNRADVQLITQTNQALTTSASTVTIPARCNAILVNNPDAAIAMLVSFDGGTTFTTVGAGKALSIEGDSLEKNNTLKIKSASGTPTAECVFGTERL